RSCTLAAGGVGRALAVMLFAIERSVACPTANVRAFPDGPEGAVAPVALRIRDGAHPSAAALGGDPGRRAGAAGRAAGKLQLGAAADCPGLNPARPREGPRDRPRRTGDGPGCA